MGFNWSFKGLIAPSSKWCILQPKIIKYIFFCLFSNYLLQYFSLQNLTASGVTFLDILQQRYCNSGHSCIQHSTHKSYHSARNIETSRKSDCNIYTSHVVLELLLTPILSELTQSTYSSINLQQIFVSYQNVTNFIVTS